MSDAEGLAGRHSPGNTHVMLTNGRGFDAHAPESDFVVVSLSRREVESGNISDALDRLLNLSDNPNHVQKFQGALSFMFEGWDADPRELQQIPEVVRFFRKLNAHWPYWFHFAETDGPTIGQLFVLLCDVELVGVESGAVGCMFSDPKQIGPVMQSLFGAMNSLHTANNIDDYRNADITDRVLKAFARFTGSDSAADGARSPQERRG